MISIDWGLNFEVGFVIPNESKGYNFRILDPKKLPPWRLLDNREGVGVCV